MSCLDIQQSDDGVIMVVKVIPGSSKTTIAGQLNGMLKIKLSAPPEKGKANQSLIEFLAKCLGVKKKTVSIITGVTSPVKKVKIKEISIEKVVSRFNLSSELGIE